MTTFLYLGIGVGILFGILAIVAFAKHKPVVGGLLLLAALLGGGFVSGLTVIDVGEVAVVYNKWRGTVRGIPAGTHVVIPVLEEIQHRYDVRIQNYTMSSVEEEGAVRRVDAIQIISKDGLPSPWDVTLLFKTGGPDPENPDPKEVALLHKTVGPSYIDKIIRPDIREGIRNIAGTYELLVANADRGEVARKIEELVRPQLKERHITLVSIRLRDIDLPEAYKKAIAEKKQKEQEAEAMKYVLLKEKQEKERKAIEAEGIAIYIKTIQAQLRADPEGSFNRWLTIEKLGDKVRVIISPAGAQPILPLGEAMKDGEEEGSSEEHVVETFKADEEEPEEEGK